LQDDEFEILGRGVTYTDVWEMQVPSMAWTRLQPTGQVRVWGRGRRGCSKFAIDFYIIVRE
jgi:hypothetical protein